MTVAELKAKGIGNIKLGSSKGSAFVYCGNAKDLCIEKLDAEIREKNARLISNAEKKIRQLERALEIATDYRDRRIKAAKEFTTIGEREVTETYPSIAERKTTIVLFDGPEFGEAWTTDEYLKMTGRKK